MNNERGEVAVDTGLFVLVCVIIDTIILLLALFDKVQL
jgi:hypothetical protein